MMKRKDSDSSSESFNSVIRYFLTFLRLMTNGVDV
jgi:hypothetical protein